MHVLTYLHVYINRAYISTSVHKSCFWKMGSCAALTLSLRSIERLSLDRQRLKVAISKKRKTLYNPLHPRLCQSAVSCKNSIRAKVHSC